MAKKTIPIKHSKDLLLSLAFLSLLLAFVYAILFEVPYSGFDFNPSDGRILNIVDDGENPPMTLQTNDVIKQIGPVTWDAYFENRRQPFFQNTSAGDVIEITVERDGEPQTSHWVIPVFNWADFWGRFFNIWWLALVFWFFGMVVQTFMRPRDTRWRLMVTANYLTAFWLVTGSLSGHQIWGSSVLLHALTWLLLPTYLHLHWIFPRPLKHISTRFWPVFYLASSVITLGELFQLLPRMLYAFGFLFMLAGSVVLLVIHFVRQPTERTSIRLLGFAVFTAISPSIILGLAAASGAIPNAAPLALIALPIMPGAYFYIVYRRQLGGMELRVNKLITLYTFLILASVIFLLPLPLLMSLELPPETLRFLIALVGASAAFISAMVYPAYQIFFEKRFLGIKLPYQNLQETYAARIVASTSLGNLADLLKNVVLPSLLIRQFAFLQIEKHSAKAVLVVGVDRGQALNAYDLSFLLASAGKYRPANSVDSNQPYPWVRLILSLQVDDKIIGFWLLGRRDPDDIYSQTELPVLQALANQTAIALSNILQTVRLRNMYQANVNRYEEERKRLALDLHDSILNQMAVLMMNLDTPEPSPRFQKAYDGLTRHLREIVSDLRPPMLSYGLKSAIEELADNLMERYHDAVSIDVDLQPEKIRYPQQVELHIFRMVQEACENALRHAQANQISISGELSDRGIILSLKDDGVGFDTSKALDLDALIAEKHFGLAGIIERAMLIEAEAQFETSPGNGTSLQIIWKPEYKLTQDKPIT